jgi:hypothetical protein
LRTFLSKLILQGTSKNCVVGRDLSEGPVSGVCADSA